MTEQTPIPKADILYIDDDPTNRTLVNRLLTNQQFKVWEAENGLAGLELAQTLHPALILMDINMPGLDGHETTTRLRSIPELAHIPVVAVTARTTPGERELALAAGCDGYIPKPINVDTFPDQISAYLHGKHDTISAEERQRYLSLYNQKLVSRLEEKIIALEEANTKLQNIDKIKSDFIILAAHELRTPITLIYGYARLLQLKAGALSEDGLPEGSVGDLSARIFNSVYRLNHTVNDILNISLIAADEMALTYEPVNLGDIIKAAYNDLNPAKNDRTLTVGYKGLDNLPPIIGDSQRLQQVFWNLLSNAIKYTPDGNSIVITGNIVDAPPAVPPPFYHAGNANFNGGIIISIKDSGIGISPADQPQIFEQFYTTANTAYHSSSKVAVGGGGIGLGLPIARGIVQAHHGQIWVESLAHNPHTLPGSTFFVFLPLGDKS